MIQKHIGLLPFNNEKRKSKQGTVTSLYDEKHIPSVVKNANEDHCGPCGVSNIVTTNEIENNTKNNTESKKHTKT